ncbi:biopolymer transporter ExbD [Rubrimonas sp.]|uniref:biopolymer transporter ExbD n=1 Tax=Rubrimonas sp. TaxID=2036015 RepID=UPI002FDEA507
MTDALGLAPAPARRRIGLAPMIDVVFLLLVFFLLAARFGAESAVAIAAGGAGEGWSGPPRLVEVEAGGALRLNGAPIEASSLGAALAALSAGPDDPVALRARGGATAQALADALAALEAAGARRVLLLESRDAP